MAIKLDSNDTTDTSKFGESRRGFFKLLGGQLSGETDDNNSNNPEDKEGVMETVSQVLKLGEMNRRSAIVLPARLAALAAIAKIGLQPREAHAEYTSVDFINEMRTELDPNQIQDADHALLDSIDVREGVTLEKPVLYYDHNVRGKQNTKNKIHFTPSLAFETAKWSEALIKGKIDQIEDNKIILENALTAMSPSHPDYKRMMEVHKNATRVNAENEKDWLPLAKLAQDVTKEVQKLVQEEQSKAKSKRKKSPAQDPIYVPPVPFKARPPAHENDFDNFEEFFPELKTFQFSCGDVPHYNEGPRPQSHLWTLEMAYLLKNVAQEYHDAAYQREMAYANIRSYAERLPSDAKTLRNKLLKIAGKRPSSRDRRKTIRDKWAALLGKNGDITKLVKGVTASSRKEMNRGYEINRCTPVSLATGAQQQIFQLFVGNVRMSAANQQNLQNSLQTVVSNATTP